MDEATYAASAELLDNLYQVGAEKRLPLRQDCATSSMPQTTAFYSLYSICLAVVIEIEKAIKVNQCWERSKTASQLGHCVARPLAVLRQAHALGVQASKKGQRALSNSPCSRLFFKLPDQKKDQRAIVKVFKGLRKDGSVKRFYKDWKNYLRVFTNSSGEDKSDTQERIEFADKCAPSVAVVPAQ